MGEPPPPEGDRPRWKHVLALIGVFQIAFVIPLSLLGRWLPGKGGGNMDAAPHFLDDPTYLESVAVNFVVWNVLLFAVGVVLVVGAKILEARDASS